MEVVEIEELRDVKGDEVGHHRVTLDLKVTGIEVNKHNRIKIEQVDAAMDNLGTPMQRLEPGIFDDEFSDSPKIRLALSPAKRQATEIKEIKGKLTVISESDATDVSDINSHLNSDLLPDSPDNLRILLFDRVILDSVYQAYTRDQAQNIIAQLRTAGHMIPDLSRPLTGPGLPADATTLDLLTRLGYKFDDNRPEKTLHFVISDPEEQITQLDVVDGYNRSMVRGTYNGNSYKMLTLMGKVQADWKILLRTKERSEVRRLDFVIRGVKLP